MKLLYRDSEFKLELAQSLTESLITRDKVQDALEFVYALFPRLKERRSQKAGTLSGNE